LLNSINGPKRNVDVLCSICIYISRDNREITQHRFIVMKVRYSEKREYKKRPRDSMVDINRKQIKGVCK